MAVPQRSDMLMFMSAPLEHDLAVCGAVSAELYVSTDAPDADLTIKLVDCYPDDGPCLNLADGILRLRYREGFESASLAARLDVPVRATIEANPTAALVQGRATACGSTSPVATSRISTSIRRQCGPQGVPGARQSTGPHRRSTAAPTHPSRLTLVIAASIES
jgi:predicted acyl esterase